MLKAVLTGLCLALPRSKWKAKTVGLAAAMLLSVFAQAQNKAISGTVTSASSQEPLIGATVLIKHSSSGTITDADGSYQITASDKDTLVFSYTGYLPVEIAVAGRTTIDIQLDVNVALLDEIVVVGYGTQRKSDLTGSVSVISTSDMEKYATNDVAQLLQGRAPGIAVNSDGHPGAFPRVRIRGIGTFGNAEPLYVIDGVPIGTTPRDFNPNDIESVQILKDASAGAIYGSRAANGVVIITTKKGKKNTPLRVEYNAYYGIDKVWQDIPVLAREQYQMLNNESQLNGGETVAPGNDPNDPLYIDNIDTDWQAEGFQTGHRQNHNLTFSGGGDYLTYNLSLDYFGNDGTLAGNGPTYDRYSVRVNTEAEKGIFKVGQSLYYTHSNENLLAYEGLLLAGGRPTLIGDLIVAIPTMPVYDPDRKGGFGGTSSAVERAISLNVIGLNSLIEDFVDVDRMFGVTYGELTLLNRNGNSLKYKLNLSYDRTLTRDFHFQPAFDLGFFFQKDVPALDDGSRVFTTGLVENTLNFEKQAGNHQLSVLVGQMYQEGSLLQRSGYSEQLPEPYFPVLNNGTNKTASGFETRNVLLSYLGRINYSFADRYLITATIRRDGSSRFAPSNRYGNFPSVAVAWKLHNEAFLNLPDAVSELKLRASYGKLGNQEIGEYLYSPSINANILYNFNGQRVVGGLQTQIVSEDIKWETKTTTNVGLDLAFLQGRFALSAEYYDSETEDILVGVPIAESNGATNTPIVNAGILKNSGLDFTATYRQLEGAFQFDVSANVATLSNEVVALGGNDEPIFGIGSITEVGSEIGQHYGWDVEGIFQSQAEIEAHAFQNANTAPGDLMFRDVNEDGVIDADDRTYLGSAIPSLYYGFNFNATYKNFDFTLFASGASGYLIYGRLYRDLMHTQGYINYHEDALNRWTPQNTNTDVPRLVAGDPNENARDSNREGWLQDGAHLRVNTVSLGYTFPSGLIPYLSRLRIYATIQNLYSFQAYKGFNPDFVSRDLLNNPSIFEPGFDFGSFPKPRTFLFGVQVAF
ncbi:MAG: TonB-dependent receptor [Phaeodactylibacter sp.]|nr:TonB-dependent receptor [Phaeodactylibacter sp.]MCB9273127.1 TonB-dependent receptor [Lewinellaceae bacterium]